MDTKALKLHLIQQILESDDETVLQAAAELLKLSYSETTTTTDSGDISTPGDRDGATRKLQEEIDAAFNPWLSIRPPGKE